MHRIAKGAAMLPAAALLTFANPVCGDEVTSAAESSDGHSVLASDLAERLTHLRLPPLAERAGRNTERVTEIPFDQIAEGLPDAVRPVDLIVRGTICDVGEKPLIGLCMGGGAPTQLVFVKCATVLYGDPPGNDGDLVAYLEVWEDTRPWRLQLAVGDDVVLLAQNYPPRFVVASGDLAILPYSPQLDSLLRETVTARSQESRLQQR